MFDATGAFTKQFTPFRDGYLVYPSRKSGGKLVTADEYERLVGDWKQVAGKAGTWKTVGVVIATIALWTALTEAFPLPAWTTNLFIAAIVIAMSARLLWASMAPRRLVRDREAIAPPRPAVEARREARAALNWWFVIFALILSGGAFFGAISATERNFSMWAWLVGSGLMFAAYLWIGFKKLIDGRG